MKQKLLLNQISNKNFNKNFNENFNKNFNEIFKISNENKKIPNKNN